MLKTNPLYLYTYVWELFAIIVTVLISAIISKHKMLSYVSLGCLCVLLLFYRNNYEWDAGDSRRFLSPSSSRISEIFRDASSRRTIVRTYISPFDEHFMISPVDCVVKEKIYSPQRDTDSECMRHIMEDGDGEVFYVDQIVSKPLHWGWVPSIIYDRCVSFVDVGQHLKQGERYGLIRFGSNMEYGIPDTYNLHIENGQKLAMGESLTR